MKFFVAFFVLCCAFSVQGACNFQYTGDGGVLDENSNYKTDSVLVWVDVANNCAEFATDDGLQWLATWIIASESFNDSRNGPVIPSVAARSIGLANRCFCNMAGKIVNNQPLDDWFRQVCDDFGRLLATGTEAQVNEYMINAYPEFNARTCIP